MKSIVLSIPVAALLAVSCLGGNQKNEITQTVCVDFEFSNSSVSETFKEDSVYTTHMFVYGGMICFYSDVPEGGGSFHGGVGLQMGSDSTVLATDPTYRYRACSTSGGNDGSSFYAFFHSYEEESLRPDYDVTAYLYSNESTATPIYMYFNNTNLVVNQVKYGYGLPGGAFTDGDWIKLTVTGYHDGVETGSVTEYLVDYDTRRNYIVTSWTPLKLDSIGVAEALRFEVTSNREDVARDFCFDDLYIRVHQVY